MAENLERRRDSRSNPDFSKMICGVLNIPAISGLRKIYLPFLVHLKAVTVGFYYVESILGVEAYGDGAPEVGFYL